MDMILLYILIVAYILAINFYAFLLVKSMSAQETEKQQPLQQPLQQNAQHNASQPSQPSQQPQQSSQDRTRANSEPTEQSSPQKCIGKLCITGALGGAIAIYVCMFIFKFRRSDLLLMVLMPLLGVLNVYLWILLFRSGLGFFIVR